MTNNSIYYASLNGTIVQDGSLLPLSNRALWYGDGIFETIAARQGVPLKPQLHVDRLRMHAEEAELEVPWDDEVLLREIHSAAYCQFDRSVIRLMVFRGGSLGLFESGESQRLVIASESPTIPESFFKDGMKLKSLSTQMKANSNRKSLCWADTIVQLRKAARNGFDDLLWVHDQEGVMEASASNIFFIGREGDLVEIATPPVTSGILAGTTRDVLINLLNSANIPVTVRSVHASELPRFDEAFLTSSVRGLVPISLIDKKKFYSTRANATFHHIHRLYESWINLQIEKPGERH